MRNSAPRVALTTVLFLLTLLIMHVSASLAATCDMVAAPTGSDRAAGTMSAPFATVQKLVDTLAPGRTGCLRSGVFSQDVTITHGGTATADLTVRSYPGETATIQGRLRLTRGADYTTISDLRLIGIEHGHQCSKLCASPTIDATHTTFLRDDVTNDHADTICFLLGDSGGVYGSADYTLLQSNRIHDCGSRPASNLDHGIYVEETHGSQILDNLIYANADRGVQLYPHSVGTIVRGNVIFGNGEGVDFGASGPQSSNDNVVEDNIIGDSNVLYNVQSAYGPGARVGTGNIVRHNCIGGGALDNSGNPGGIRFDHSGFMLTDNVLGVASFVDPAHGDFSLASGSQCRGILPTRAGTSSTSVRVTRSQARRRARSQARSQARSAPLRITLSVASVRPGRVRLVQLSGTLRRHSTDEHQAVVTRAGGLRRIFVRAFHRGRWSTVASARTRSDGGFDASVRVSSPDGEMLQATTSGVGHSNRVLIR